MRTEQASHFMLELNEQERNELLLVLNQALSEGRAERRRTEAFDVKEVVSAEVDLLERLLEKVRGLPVGLPPSTVPRSTS